MRIKYLIFRIWYKVPYLFFKIWWYSLKSHINYNKGFAVVREIALNANKAGKVTIECYGKENIPKENGFIIYPNHQGMFDVLAILETCENPFAFVFKQELKDVILLKQVIAATGSMAMDRDDIKQSLRIINDVAAEVKLGRNFLIFAEGTRSREGNKLLPFKGGSFKSATKAKCPIVPAALIDCYKPFDEKSIDPVTVKVIYLPPIPYEEYKDLKTVDIAEMVKERIEKVIEENVLTK